ncbi:hypothetical protein QH494_24540 [Sphingomonas sp. AR_OL41]|jgi:hypothetical protein|uniref:hypothetical protein n=1 Tax=Sphingomonas sp. AR_OL41 TaxID=3042729 RepID=UPI00247FA256|nr:hypothetical protein [Sphingomonas sp. AR_OL41]MDH7975368.1 hypothetical protein [Sphingomonas sp. AR_OL41]
MIKNLARSAVIVIFGGLVPVMLMLQAYVGLSSLNAEVRGALSSRSVAQALAEAKPTLRSANDYALYSVIAAERANQSVVTNKQVMKIAVMQIGFAVASIGVMFIILGFRDGAVEGGFATGALRFDLKTGSTGVVVFVLGAAMATAGGVLRNEYSTVPIPGFVQVEGIPAGADERTIAHFKECRALGGAAAQECFFKTFEKVNAEALQ